MATTYISVFEHQPLKVGGEFTANHLQLLQKFYGDCDSDAFPYFSLINGGVKFKHYVGVLSVGNLQIEVLPKIDKQTQSDKDIWRNHLLEMLSTVFCLQAHTPSNASQRLTQSPVLDVFLQKFLNEVETLIHKGLIKTYRKVEENRSAMKGKLLFSKHMRHNAVHKERFFVSFTAYDRNHVLNRILYKALKLIPEIARNGYIHSRATSLAFEFPELNDITVDECVFERLRFDRKSDDYRSAIEIAKLILLRFMPDHTKHHNHILALMFDMNRLWEEYVYVILKRRWKGEVSAQRKKVFWESEAVGIKAIKPDIVVSNTDETPFLVIDTKWKCPTDRKPSDADLKQMYVYHKYWNVQYTALLYPSLAEHRIDGNFKQESNLQCSMLFVPLNLLQDKNQSDKLEELIFPMK